MLSVGQLWWKSKGQERERGLKVDNTSSLHGFATLSSSQGKRSWACARPLEEKEKQEGMKEVLFGNPGSFVVGLCRAGRRFLFSID